MINKITLAACSLLFTAALNGAQAYTPAVQCISTATSIGYGLFIPSRTSAVAVWRDLQSKTYNGCEVNSKFITKPMSSKRAQKIYAIAEKQWKQEQQALLQFSTQK